MRVLAIASAVLLLGTVTACADGNEIEEESPGLAARAQVAGKDARATALARVPGGKIEEAVLEQEDGRLVYSFDIEVEGEAGIEEVLVDAVNGQVVSSEHETEKEEEASGAPEAESADRSESATSVAELSEETPGLLARAQVSDAEARAAALERVPGAIVVAAEIEEEDGRLIYSYDLKVGDAAGIEEVHVDASTGKVMSVEHEGEG